MITSNIHSDGEMAQEIRNQVTGEVIQKFNWFKGEIQWSGKFHSYDRYGPTKSLDLKRNALQELHLSLSHGIYKRKKLSAMISYCRK